MMTQRDTHTGQNATGPSTEETTKSVRPVLGVLFGLFALMVITISLASRNVNTTPQETPTGAFSQTQIARAAIATALDQTSAAIEVVRMENGVVYTAFTRAPINPAWVNRCKITGTQAILATPTGRWKTDKHNDKITFTATDTTLVMTCQSADGSLKKRDFSLQELNI